MPVETLSESSASGSCGGVTVRFTLRLPRLLWRTVTVTVCVVVTGFVSTLKRRFVIPAAISIGGDVCEKGRKATDGLVFEAVNVSPPEGATAPDTSGMLTSATLPPTMLEGWALNVPRAVERGET